MEGRVAGAVEEVAKVLALQRRPCAPHSSHHSYDDKFSLAEYLGNSFIHSFSLLLARFGLSSSSLEHATKWFREQSAVSITFSSRETCELKKNEKRKVEDEVSSTTIGIFSSSRKVVTYVEDGFGSAASRILSSCIQDLITKFLTRLFFRVIHLSLN
jgi:hypothetical protein